MGELEQVLLFAMVRLGNAADAIGIQAEVRARTGRELAPGAVYTALDRLRARGYVSSWLDGAASPRGGRRRRRYRIERAGARALARTYAQLLRMSDGTDAALAELASVPWPGEPGTGGRESLR